MRNRSLQQLLIGALLLAVCATLHTQTSTEEPSQLRATTEDGKTVILYADGTWEYEDARLYDVSRTDIRSSADVDLSQATEAVVIKWTDGDTFDVLIQSPPNRLKQRETIRLLGVDAPELNHEGQVEPFSFEASEYTKDRVYNKAVLLVFDRRLRDQYGRVLAYVYLPDGSCLNAELLEQGYARLFSGEECWFTEEFRLLEGTARQEQVGLWAEEERTVFIAEIHNAGYEEYLVIRNGTKEAVQLRNWRIVDDDGTVLLIPDGVVLEPQGTVTIYSGSDGVHDPPRSYYLTKQNIWNNNGDVAYLYSAANELVDTYRY